MATPGENPNPIWETEKPQEEQRLEDEILGLQVRLLGIFNPGERKKIETSLSESQKNLQKLREERMERERSILQGGAGPEEQAAQLLGRHLGRLEDLRDERETPPGFAQLPEPSDEFKALEALSAEERFQILRAILSQKIEVVDERVRKQKEFLLLKLSYLQLLAEQLSKGRMFKSSKWSEQWASFLKSEPYTVKSWFQENSQDLIGKIMADEKFDLIAALPPNIKKILEKLSGKKLQALQTKESVYERYAAAIQAMRDDSDYEAAQQLMEELLAAEFEKGKKKIGRAWIDQIKAQVARGKIFQLYVDQQNAWKKAGMNDEQIIEYYHELLRIEEEREVNKRVAQYILGSTVAIPTEKRAIWENYQAMLDPKHEWFNVSDEQWDTAMREIAINAPLILLSGGIASVARAGISRVGMSILERQGAKLLGKEFFQQTVLSRALSRGIVWTTQKGGGMLVEGAVFDATHKALTGEQYHSLPDWAQSVIWSSVSLGVFHGSGKISERLFTKHIGNLPVNTWLGAKLAHITVASVREAAKVLLIKGHIEAATMLFIGAVQNKAYTGSLQEFMDNIGNEILHAYITVGALKISGITMSPIMRRLTLAPKQQRVELTRANRKEILDILENPKTSRAEKLRIVETLEEHCGEELHAESYLGRAARELFPERFKNTNVSPGGPDHATAPQPETQPLPDFSKKFPKLAKEFDLKELFPKARVWIIEYLNGREDTKHLPLAEKEKLALQEYGNFLEKLELVRKRMGRDTVKFILSNFSDSPWIERLNIAESALRVKNPHLKRLLRWLQEQYSNITKFKSNVAEHLREQIRITEKASQIESDYEKNLEQLEKPSKEPLGKHEGTKILRMLRDNLTPAEQTLSKKDQSALIRVRFYRIQSELVRKAGALIDGLEQYVRDNPNVSREQLLQKAKELGLDELPSLARKKVKIALLRLEKNRSIIELYKAHFSPAQLFEKFFGCKPFERVTIDTHSPFIIHFLLEPIDLFRVYRGQVTESRADVEKAFQGSKDQIGGFRHNEIVTAGDRNLPASYRDQTFTHEERHAIHLAFMSLGEKLGAVGTRWTRAEKRLAQFKQKLSESASPEFQQALQKEFLAILEQFQESFLERAKDEILAFSKEGRNSEEIQRILFGRGSQALYDYQSKQESSILSSLPPWLSEWATRRYNEMGHGYRDKLSDALFLVKALLDGKSHLSPEERNHIIQELSITPIDRWHAVFGQRVKPAFEKKSEEFESLKKRLADSLHSLEDAGNDYLEFWNFRDRLRTVLKWNVFQHDLAKLVHKSGFLKTLKKVMVSNIEWLNRHPPSENARDNLTEDLHKFFEEIPLELREIIAQECKPLFEKIHDSELSKRWEVERQRIGLVTKQRLAMPEEHQEDFSDYPVGSEVFISRKDGKKITDGTIVAYDPRVRSFLVDFPALEGGRKQQFFSRKELDTLNRSRLEQQRTAFLLDKWLRTHGGQSMAAEALTGEMEYVVPIIAGLKPAGIITMPKDSIKGKMMLDFVKKHITAIPGFAFMRAGTSGDIVLYNEASIQKTVTEHPDIFGPCKITPDMQPREIIRRLFKNSTALHRDFYGAAQDKAVGLVLGFDKQSVIQHAENQPGSIEPMLWGVSYIVYDPAKNQDYHRLQESYDKLLNQIRSWIKEGHKPLEILHMLQTQKADAIPKEETG